MASNHVPSDQVPLQGQSIYTESPYHQNLFPPVDRYGTPSWDTQLNQHSGLASNAGSTQAWHHGSFPQQQQTQPQPQPQSYNTFNQSYGTQSNGYQQTASPYQYGQFGQQGSMPSYSQPANVDPSLGLDPNALRQQQQSPYQMSMRNTTPQAHSGTVTPQALQHNGAQLQNSRPTVSPFQMPRTTTEMFAQRAMPATIVKPVPVPSYEIPRGKKSGGLYILDQAALAKATKSTALNKLVTLGSEPFHLPTNRTALPLYTPRQSVKELKKIGADNKKLLARIQSKPSVTKAPRGLKREDSDSDSATDSSDDESEYTDDEEDDEPSPLPAARPEEPHEAVRYDIIKATWHPRKSPLSSDQIKDGMRDIWEVLNTIQKRWRADSKAVTDAEDQKKTGELPVLKSRVTSQRDLLQSALKAALDYAHPDVLYQLGKIKPFVYLCYQFLANRFRMKDFDGPLSAVIYEVLTRCGTLTSELLEETKAIKALVSMKKQANEKHKAFIQQIIDSAAANSKKAQASSPPTTEPAEAKTVKRPAAEQTTRASSEGMMTKRPKPADGPANAIKKSVATPLGSKAITMSTSTLPQKKPTAAPAPVKNRVSQVTNKPSGIFASLNAASKKPATTPAASKPSLQTKPVAAASKDKKPAATTSKPAFSFAQTMASLLKPKEPEAAPVKSEKQLPPETPEEKAKRLRKEARRHLRVTFKPDTALVQIKYFSHDPDEELGHDENFVRHAGDIGGEGAMFKQHKEHDIDDDDDDEPELDNKPWREPSQVDFSAVPTVALDGNYAPYGGGKQMPSCPEKEANLRRENATLMVFYADPNDIPSSPREPLEQDQESAPAVTVTNFGTPPDHVLAKGSQSSQAQVPAPVAIPDLSSLENIFKQFALPAATQPPAMSQPAPVPQTTYAPPMPMASNVDLQSILSALKVPAAPQVQAPPQYPSQAPAAQFPPPSMDFNAIMSAISASAGNGTLPPPPPGFPPFPLPFAMPPQQMDSAAYQLQQQPQYTPQDYNTQTNGGIKRQREETGNNDRGQGKKHKNRGERPHKVLPCKFFQMGKCSKGDNCTYVHDLNM
ncbi:hypothetical protein HBI82_185200 [Parastagonospora nodorum]|nr:hypothetical protein HBI74_131480 [Parastagonospora nodorum]KAH5992549.1 hypothetical protein HBI82_185200 [Parastagonospora nodorum]KAH6105576.1 hypothetical protein HBI65_032780 [Parastagonospora nodorum]